MFKLSPPKISFSSPGSSVMEFRGFPSNSRSVADFTSSELSDIELYIYDWTIMNYNMIKPIYDAATSPVFRVGTEQDRNLRMSLSPSADDSVRIEVELLHFMEQSDEKDKSKENSTKIPKLILGLEFLDSNGKTIDYYMGLPYEFKAEKSKSTYTWKKDENASRFVQNDSLTIRVKLSLRYYSIPSLAPPLFSSALYLKSPVVLMKDMKKLFLDRNLFPDLIIKVGGQFFLAHKSILFAQCPHFTEMLKNDTEINSDEFRSKLPKDINDKLKEDYAYLSIPNENADVFLCVLHFIYCGQLYVTDTVNDFAVYDFAKKYCVRELSMLMMPTKMHSVSQVKLEKVNFMWYVKNFSSLRKGDFSPIFSPTFKTSENGDSEWGIVLFYMDPQNIILSLRRMSGQTTDVQTMFKLAVCKADGSIHEVKEFKHLYTCNNIANCHPGLMNSESRFLIPLTLLFNDTLTVSCNLIASSGGLISELKRYLRGEYSDVDLTCWKQNLQMVFEKEMFSDAVLLVDEKIFKVHRAILSVRSPVFARMFDIDMEEKRSRCVRIEDICDVVMKQALIYVYTGELVDLSMDHAPELYRAADKYEILNLKAICGEFIMKNMDADNACDILVLSDLYNDKSLKEAAKNMICRNAARSLLSPRGRELLKNHILLAQEILESLSAGYCSLPPQDMFEKARLFQLKCFNNPPAPPDGSS